MADIWYTDWGNTRPTGWPNWLTGAQHTQHGYTGTLRYVTSPGLMQPPNPGNRKHITRAEYEDLVAHGIDVWLVYQGSTTDADGGYALGRRNAQRVVEACTNTSHSSGRQGPIGYDGPVFFTNDRTTLPSPKAWQDYLDGAASVLGVQRVGAYGFGNAMDAALGHATWFWQAGRRRDVRQHVHFWQDNNFQPVVEGILCDRNLVLKSIERDDMATAEEIAAAVWRHPIAFSFGGKTATYLAQDWIAWTNKYAADGADDEDKILAMLADLASAIGGVDGTPSDAQVAALAAQLRSGLGDAVAEALGRRLLTQEGNPA